MIRHLIRLAYLLLIIILSGCKYNKGDMYTSALTGDGLNYLIMAKGSGEKISQKASDQKLNYEYKGSSCQIKYLTDSAKLNSQKGILLVNVTLPNIEDDMLTKGYIGTLSSKQQVILLLVSDEDFERYFRKTELKKKY